VEVRERSAAAISKVGAAEAEGIAARLRAEADGARAKALAEAEGTTAQAAAESALISGRLKAEAEGLTEKAAAMAALDEASRGHEEYRLRLAAEKDVRLAGLETQRQIAEAQASVLAKGLEKADVQIVGGDDVFFDRLLGAVTAGRSIDSFVASSDTVRTLGAEWLDGSGSFTEDATKVLAALAAGNGGSTGNGNAATVLAHLLGQLKDQKQPLAPANGAAQK
jgi:hypothetical protein